MKQNFITKYLFWKGKLNHAANPADSKIVNCIVIRDSETLSQNNYDLYVFLRTKNRNIKLKKYWCSYVHRTHPIRCKRLVIPWLVHRVQSAIRGRPWRTMSSLQTRSVCALLFFILSLTSHNENNCQPVLDTAVRSQKTPFFLLVYASWRDHNEEWWQRVGAKK